MSDEEFRLSEIEEELRRLQYEISQIHERNAQVERNKSWETSRSRLVAVTAITYFTMILIFTALGSSRPFLDAVVPTTGFILSAQSLSIVRKIWEKLRSPS